jgi:hypothetical protein
MDYKTLLQARRLDMMSTTDRRSVHMGGCARCVVSNPFVLPSPAPGFRWRWKGEGARNVPSWPSFASEYTQVYAGKLVGFA